MRLAEITRSPGVLFKPFEIPAQVTPYQSDVSILHADLGNFSGAVEGNAALRVSLQSWLSALHSEIQGEPACERVKNDGDGFWVFSTDSLWLFEKAQQLGSRLDQFKLRNPSTLRGFRCVLTRGRLNCIVSDGLKDYDGPAAIECVRIDQPMKNYMKEHNIAGNQVWCSEPFKADVENRSSHLHFAPLPSIPLDKGYESASRLFQISVA